MKRAIVWFRSDLRVSDNETLIRAIEWADEVIPFYCYNSSWEQTTEFGTSKINSKRKKFLFESLENLDEKLKQLSSGLFFTIGNPVEEIVKLAKEYNVQRVYVKKEIASEEIYELSQAEEKLFKEGIVLENYSTSTLYKATDLPFSIKDFPNTFTDFRRKAEKESDVNASFPSPEVIKSPPLHRNHWDSILNKLDHSALPFYNFRGGETFAFERLNFYLQSGCINEYKQTRNQLYGENYSSKFSPWLANGCISPRVIYHAIKEYEMVHGENESTYWLIFELLWRDFFRFSFKKHKEKFFHKSGIQRKPVHFTHDKNKFRKWCLGETDHSLVNALMQELSCTGFMSNRGRQICASYLVYEMQCDWRYGAAWFEQELIDYDVSSNWGNWAYIAGVGNDPRGGRIFNIDKQAEIYDKDFKFRHLWLNH